MNLATLTLTPTLTLTLTLTQAIADYSAALRVEPRNAYAFYNRGITYDRMGDYASAVDDFTCAIGIDDSNADFFHNRGFRCGQP